MSASAHNTDTYSTAHLYLQSNIPNSFMSYMHWYILCISILETVSLHLRMHCKGCYCYRFAHSMPTRLFHLNSHNNLFPVATNLINFDMLLHTDSISIMAHWEWVKSTVLCIVIDNTKVQNSVISHWVWKCKSDVLLDWYISCHANHANHANAVLW